MSRREMIDEQLAAATESPTHGPSEDLARLKYRCAGCSQVKPMPPWIWMFSAVVWKYASEQ